MNNIYIKEKEVSSKEKISKDNLSLSMDLKKHELSLNAERKQQSKRLQNIQFMAPHFHQKVSQKHTEIKIQSLEQGLPGTALEGS